jgi:hypothetical protein
MPTLVMPTHLSSFLLLDEEAALEDPLAIHTSFELRIFTTFLF